MKSFTQFLEIRLILGVLVITAAAGSGRAQPALQPRIVLRPLTAVDVKTYGLPADSELSGGLSAIGIGTPAYLEVEVSGAFPARQIPDANAEQSTHVLPGDY